ncbi:MAG: sensor histidine kinase [Sporichthyaceae bacterium]
MTERRLRAPRSVRVRILAWVVGLAALGLAGAGGAFYVVELQRADQRLIDSLTQEVSEFDALAREGVDPLTGAAFTSASRLLEVGLGRSVPDEHQVLIAFLGDRPVFVQGTGADELIAAPEFIATVNALRSGGAGSLDVAGSTVRFAVKPVAGNADSGSFVAAGFADDERAELTASLRTYSAVAAAALLAVALGAWSVSGRLLRPLRDLRLTADQISHSDLTRRIEASGNDDISDLARTFNAMLARLEDSFAAQRRFLDDAGHELRTPVTIVRGHLELMDIADVEDVSATRDLVIDELDRMSRLIDDLVVLARAERPDFLRQHTVDLGALTDDVLDKVRALGERDWRLDARAEAEVDADPQRLTQALVQLAANAVSNTGAGSTIAVGSAVEDGRARLWVRDDGPGVDPADSERIFERFERGAGASSDGAGLGLSIVRAIALAHDGRVRVEPATAYGGITGAVFVLEVPARPARSEIAAVGHLREEGSTAR